MTMVSCHGDVAYDDDDGYDARGDGRGDKGDGDDCTLVME